MRASRPAPTRNLVLIGLMGCGKSTVGRDLHRLLGYPLIDTDHEIERITGMPVRRIFEETGEQAFRDLETAQLEEMVLGGRTRSIIATGGGAVVRPGNRVLLRKLGFVVWLDAPLSEMIARTGRNQNRPLLHAPDPAAVLAALREQRAPWYAEAAHLRVNTRDLDSAELAVGILESARYYFSNHS